MIRKYFYNGLAEFSPVFIGFISAMILTRRLGLQQWGIYSQILWLVGIAGIFLSFGLTYGTARYLAQYIGENQQSEVRKTIIFTGSIQLICSIIGAIIFFSLSSSLVNWFHWHISAQLIRIAGLGIVSFSLYQFSIYVLRGLQLFKLLAAYSGIYSAAILVITIICINWPLVELLLILTYIAQLLLLPWIWKYIFRATSLHKSDLHLSLPIEWNGLVRFSFVIYLALIVDQIVWQRSEVFFLAQLPDASQTGIYSLAYTVAFVGVGIIPSAITGVLTPVFTEEVTSKGKEHLRLIYQSNFTFINWFVLPMAIGLLIFAPILLSDLFASEYPSATMVLTLLILSSTIAIYSRPSASILHALNLPKVLLIGSVCALPVNLFLAWKMVPTLGAFGAAVANIIAQAIAGSITIGYVSFRVGVNYDWKVLGQALIGSFFCGATAWGVMTLIPIPIIRLIAASILGLLIYILVLYKMKEEIATRIVAQFQSTIHKYLTQLSTEP
jgi:O-antigen/teichoic acid export membrane protein